MRQDTLCQNITKQIAPLDLIFKGLSNGIKNPVAEKKIPPPPRPQRPSRSIASLKQFDIV